jgi:TonB family protein
MAHTILLVDYEPRTVTRVTEALAPLGCQILTAKDVDAAVSACARVEPRVVLITSVMPKVKVEDAITQVRARAGLRHTPFIVLMSGYSGDDPKSDASRLGAQDIVAKPFSGDDLLTRVRAALQTPRGATQSDSKADVLEALRRSAGLKPDKGTLTSEDLFGDLIGDADEDRPVAAETQRITVTPSVKPAPPAEPEPPRGAGETQRVPLDLVMQATAPAPAAPKAPKPAARSATSEADKAVADSLSGMLDHPAKAGKVREDTGGASVDELLHQTLSGLEGGLPKRKPAALKPSDQPVVPAPAPTPQPAAPAKPVAHPAAPVHEPAPTSPSVGTLFGQYELMEVISTGGMAEVFKARMKGVEGFQKIVAIKRILPHLTENDEFVTMFIDEAKLAAQLQHPNIIHIYDLGKIERSYYIAMEYIDGKDLRSLLRLIEEKGQRLPLGIALYVASRLAAALDYAHRKRDFQGRAMALVHRDVSPQNVLISLDGDIKLCDFGIAKAASKASHTRAGALKGKLQYMSPEQAWGKDLDHRSDIFSLGLVMYEMVTGKKAFSGDSELSILEQVRSPKLQAPRQIDPSVPPEVERIILRAIEPNRDTRYQTAAELGSDLDAALRTVRPTPGSAELGAFLAHLLGRDRTGAMPAVTEPATPKRGAARHEARHEPAPRKAEQLVAAPHAAEATPQLEVAQPVPVKKPLPIGIIGAAAAVVLGIVIVYVVTTRRAPSAAPAGQVAATPAPETVEMARQIAQAEVQKREGEMRERLTRELLTATPVPRAAGPAPALAATRPAAASAQPTQVPEAVPTEAPAAPVAAPPPPTEVPAAQAEPTPVPATPPAPAPQRAPEAAVAAAVQRGDLVDMADTDVQAVDTPKPSYPPLARQQRIGGVVILRALIDENGTVQDVQVLRGVKPDLGLDAAASGAVKRWRFRPATKGGVPVKLWKTITIPFQP